MFGQTVLRGAALAGLAFALATSVASAQVVVSSGTRATKTLSHAQLREIIKIAKPMEKVHRPSGVNGPSRIPVAGAPLPAPATVAGDRGPADGAGRMDDGGGSGVGRQGGQAPQNYGSGNLNTIFHYNDYLIPRILLKTFPYRATGFFLFQQNGGWFICSAALISNSILLTAGHCVHSGNNSASGWNTDGYYYPGSENENGGGTPYEPYGWAQASSFATWTCWFANGDLDQGCDVGVVVLKKANGTTKEMGKLTGWYGFCVLNCRQNFWFFTQLGYPGNYYGANQMTTSQHLATPSTNNPLGGGTGLDYIWGSGMRGGSSGGPHVSNIGDISDSASDPGQWTFRNIIFHTTSWGYISEAWKIQGGSPLSQAGGTNGFKPLYNLACNGARALHGRRSCTPL